MTVGYRSTGRWLESLTTPSIATMYRGTPDGGLAFFSRWIDSLTLPLLLP